MTATSQIPACRVELDKRPAEYLVIADDTDPFTNAADYFREDRIPVREVRYVERQATDPEEQRLQRDELEGACLDAEGPLSLLTYTAVSHGHAAYLARREHAMAMAAERMAEVIDSHLGRGTRGWIAIRIADGGSDGAVYADAVAAQAAQERPERCTYFHVSPLNPWSVQECAEHLEFMADLGSGRMARDFGTSH